MNEYEKQAQDFLQKTGTTMTVKYLRHAPYLDNRDTPRNIYKITFKRGNKSMSLTFGQSLLDGSKDLKPTAYDVLACIEKYETPNDPWEFASEFGYEINSRTDFNKVAKICEACEKQYNDVLRMWPDAIEDLQEIA